MSKSLGQPSDCPFPEPTEHRDLRQTRFHEADDGLIERWVWDPTLQAYELRTRKTREEWDAGAARVIDNSGPITEADQERARKLADEMGWE